LRIGDIETYKGNGFSFGVYIFDRFLDLYAFAFGKCGHGFYKFIG